MQAASWRLLGGIAAASLLSGCVAAAAVPVVAAGGIYKSSQDRKKRRQEPAPQAEPVSAASIQTPNGSWTHTTLTELPPPSGTPAERPVLSTAAGGTPVPPGMQFLYGSGEAAALSVQAYQGLWSYVRNRALDRKTGGKPWSVVLSREGTLGTPEFMPCGAKPLAVVLDIDETALLNLGYESSDAQRGNAPYDEKRWDRWERTGANKVTAVPGAVEALQAARREGVTVIFNSNRLTTNAAQTEAALDGAGLGPVKHGETLWLRGDDGTTSSAKDARRWQIAERYCVIALVGDQLGDFSDLFNKELSPTNRRNAATETMIAPLWGQGWFMLPNPVYGSGLKGGFDEVFPADKRWSDPAEAGAAASQPVP